jgi:hypothetical protein
MSQDNRLYEAFRDLQDEMRASFKKTRNSIDHGPTMGGASEDHWLSMLANHLPLRYMAARGFVIDSKGQLSKQIDLIIFDRQYSPLLYNDKGVYYVPAESVYAIAEIKQKINKALLTDAGKKFASVRKLHRTSAPITHAGGQFPAKALYYIPSFFLATQSGWVSGNFIKNLMNIVEEQDQDSRLDMGCVINECSFLVGYSDSKKPEIQCSEADNHLIFFFFRLLSTLQKLGTAPAVDFEQYGNLTK